MKRLMLIPVQDNGFRFKLHSWSPWLPLPKVSETNIKLLISFLQAHAACTAKNFVFSAVSLLKPRKKSYGIFTFTPNCYSCSQKMLLKTQPSCSGHLLICLKLGRGKEGNK